MIVAEIMTDAIRHGVREAFLPRSLDALPIPSTRSNHPFSHINLLDKRLCAQLQDMGCIPEDAETPSGILTHFFQGVVYVP
jgi:hypothetical protein